MFNAQKTTIEVNTKGNKHILTSQEIYRSGLLSFRETGQFSDVVLDVFGTRISAHKIVLAANSEFFKTFFCSPLNESSGETIHFGDKDQEGERMELTKPAILSLIDYLYTGHIEIESDVVMLKDVAKAANYFQLHEIVHWVYNIIKDNVSKAVFIDNYAEMEEMTLMTHLEAVKVSCWEDLRDPESFVLIAGGDENQKDVVVYDPAADMWSKLDVEMPTDMWQA